VQALERGLKRLPKVMAASSQEVTDAERGGGLRFSAKGLAGQRQRLGLSAAATAKLLGVSALSVYKWESGQTRPRAKHFPAIAALRSMGKREAAARLSELG
jgi:DNA-binding transcriptional regulator YiaG